jgi:hypothetical protein
MRSETPAAKKSGRSRAAVSRAKVRLSAKRDGIIGQVITLSKGDFPVFEKHKTDLVTELAPQTILELKLATSIAWDLWRLDHLRAIEMNMYALGSGDVDEAMPLGHPDLVTAMAAARTFAKEARNFALMGVCEERIQSNLHDNLAMLFELQAERRCPHEHSQTGAGIARAN